MVAADIVGVGQEDKSAFTDQEGCVGMPQESVSISCVDLTDIRRILDEHEYGRKMNLNNM